MTSTHIPSYYALIPKEMMANMQLKKLVQPIFGGSQVILFILEMFSMFQDWGRILFW